MKETGRASRCHCFAFRNPGPPRVHGAREAGGQQRPRAGGLSHAPPGTAPPASCTVPGGSTEKSCGIRRLDPPQMTSAAIVPICLPLTTGAGRSSAITVRANSATTIERHLELFAAVLAMAVMVALLVSVASRLTRLLTWLSQPGAVARCASAVVVGIEPAAGQLLAGGEEQIGLAERAGILKFLTGVHAALHAGGEGIEQLLEIEHLHQAAVVVMADLQEHGHLEGNCPHCARRRWALLRARWDASQMVM